MLDLLHGIYVQMGGTEIPKSDDQWAFDMMDDVREEIQENRDKNKKD